MKITEAKVEPVEFLAEMIEGTARIFVKLHELTPAAERAGLLGDMALSMSRFVLGDTLPAGEPRRGPAADRLWALATLMRSLPLAVPGDQVDASDLIEELKAMTLRIDAGLPMLWGQLQSVVVLALAALIDPPAPRMGRG